MPRGRRAARGAILLAGLLALAPGVASAQADVPPVIEKFKAKDPGMAKIFADAVGYAVFPTVGKGGLGSAPHGARAGCTRAAG